MEDRNYLVPGLIIVIVILFFLPYIMNAGVREETIEKMNDMYINDRFICVQRYSDCSIYADKETRVLYAKTIEINAGGLTVLLDENGKPLLYEGEIE